MEAYLEIRVLTRDTSLVSRVHLHDEKLKRDHVVRDREDVPLRQAREVPQARLESVRRQRKVSSGTDDKLIKEGLDVHGLGVADFEELQVLSLNLDPLTLWELSTRHSERVAFSQPRKRKRERDVSGEREEGGGGEADPL